MSTIIAPVQAGIWQADPVHSSVGFAVRHNGIATFKGGFDQFAAALAGGKLAGAAQVSSVRVDDETLNGHLLSPDFFDAERYPEIRFESTELRVDEGRFVVDGELELKGVRKPVQLDGEIRGPVTDAYGNERMGLTLETSIDRTDFGVSWNMELPGGGALVENEVKLTAELELVKEA
jgi:polyisoprenoid-binding protein YceI